MKNRIIRTLASGVATVVIYMAFTYFVLGWWREQTPLGLVVRAVMFVVVYLIVVGAIEWFPRSNRT